MKIFKRLFQKKRSVIFYRQSYYHFYYLAKALKKRGWKTLVVNLESPRGVNANYYHGEDLNLYHKNSEKLNKKIRSFFKKAKKKFDFVHFAGDGYLTFLNEHTLQDEPLDILEWKALGKKIAYTVSGCNSGMTPASVGAWSVKNNGKNVCDRCIWQNNNQVCSEEISLNWGKKVHKFCDLIFSETSPALDYMKSHPKVIRDPLTMCLDSEFWKPNLKIPRKFRIEKKEGEILVYHAVGNYSIRDSATKNIKGTPSVFSAIERLQAEGFTVKLFFVTDVPNKVVRYYQVQADIIVDQLNYGRYGATAREGMMLGKPVICYVNKFEFRNEDKLACLEECPLISASEDTLYEELKKLITNPLKRKTVGEKSRAYALKWHCAERCAERYEKAYDELFNL